MSLALNKPETDDAVVDLETGWCAERAPSGPGWCVHSLIPHKAGIDFYPDREAALEELQARREAWEARRP